MCPSVFCYHACLRRTACLTFFFFDLLTDPNSTVTRQYAHRTASKPETATPRSTGGARLPSQAPNADRPTDPRRRRSTARLEKQQRLGLRISNHPAISHVRDPLRPPSPAIYTPGPPAHRPRLTRQPQCKALVSFRSALAILEFGSVREIVFDWSC
jgi:hypothetical protein